MTPDEIARVDRNLHQRRIASEVFDERRRQDEKHGKAAGGPGHPDGTNEGYGHLAQAAKDVCAKMAERGAITWLDILHEEVMEAFAEENPAKLRVELVQVMAVALAWIEDIDTREAS